MVTLFSTIMSSSLIMLNMAPCLQESLPFVHQNLFLALKEYANFASVGASVSHGHVLVFPVFCKIYNFIHFERGKAKAFQNA